MTLIQNYIHETVTCERSNDEDYSRLLGLLEMLVSVHNIQLNQFTSLYDHKGNLFVLIDNLTKISYETIEIITSAWDIYCNEPSFSIVVKSDSFNDDFKRPNSFCMFSEYVEIFNSELDFDKYCHYLSFTNPLDPDRIYKKQELSSKLNEQYILNHIKLNSEKFNLIKCDNVNDMYDCNETILIKLQANKLYDFEELEIYSLIGFDKERNIIIRIKSLDGLVTINVHDDTFKDFLILKTI